MVEFYDELERICTDLVVLTPNGLAIAVNLLIGHGIQ